MCPGKKSEFNLSYNESNSIEIQNTKLTAIRQIQLKSIHLLRNKLVHFK